MKIKFLNGVLTIDILTVLLVLAILLIPSNVVRIILGVPFLLFFPGYTLVAALFPNRAEMDGIERIALSIGLSIATVALIGLGINYTSWGIRLEPVLFSVSVFIIVMSIIALFRTSILLRRADLTREITIKLFGWQGSSFNKILSGVLVLAILGAIGTLSYTAAASKTGEKFTEFYILGENGKADGYPVEFTMINNNQVVSVKYSDADQPKTGNLGIVSLGIVNHEQKTCSYKVILTLDGRQINITYAGNTFNQLDNIALQQGEKWEQVIGFSPLHTGDNQKMELSLYKDGSSSPENSLHLWVSVKGE